MARPIDKATVDRLVVEHLPGLLRVAMRLTGDEHAADEVVQEAMCRVLRNWRSFRGESSFRTWLVQIVVNADRDRRRRRDIVPQDANKFEPTSRDAPAAELMEATELAGEIRRAVDGLPERQREVAVLAWSDGMAPREIAGVLGITESNVYASLSLARKRIAEVIGLDTARRSAP